LTDTPAHTSVRLVVGLVSSDIFTFFQIWENVPKYVRTGDIAALRMLFTPAHLPD